MDSELSDRISKIYHLKTYMDRYGLDVWIAFIVCFIFIVLIVKYYLINKLQPLKADWIHQRCNPLVIPFAGLINTPVGESPLEFTSRNFTGCVQNVLTYVASSTFQPFYYIMQLITLLQQELAQAFNAVRAMFDNIRNIFRGVTENIYSIIMNMMVEVIHLITNIKDMTQKIAGTLTATLYTVLGSYLSLKSLLAFLLEIFIKILWVLVGTITGLLAISIIPFGFGLWALVPAGIAIALGIAVMLLLLPLCEMLADVLDIHHSDIPRIPGCFAPDTPLLVYSADETNGQPVAMADVKVGDVLRDGAKVTGTIQFSVQDQALYSLKGVRVTGEHRVFYNHHWIKVKQHPDSVPVKDYPYDHVYCLLTDSKTFYVGETLFSDWDDIDDNVLTALEKKCVVPGFLPKDFTAKDIHKYLDAGLDKGTRIEMLYGGPKTIDKVNVNDRLCNGERVLGTVKIYAQDIGVYVYGSLRCSRNVQLWDKTLGKEINLMTKIPYDDWQVFADGPYLYHLLTDTGYFMANGMTVCHYNSAIDTYVLEK